MAVYQYFLSVVPTRYLDPKGYEIKTNQYSVTDYKRNPQGQIAYPGLYFKYDIEPLMMIVAWHSVSFVAFLVRLVGVLGGVWLCTMYAFRAVNRFAHMGQKILDQIGLGGSKLENASVTSTEFDAMYAPNDVSASAFGGSSAQYGAYTQPKQRVLSGAY